MAVSNTIFTNSKKADIKTIISTRGNDMDSAIMSTDTERYFNTYKYWEPFQVPMENLIEKNEDEVAYSTFGTKSIFNNVNAIFAYNKFREDANMPLFDTPDSRQYMRKEHSCTIKDLVENTAADKMGRQIYNYSDFAYCKYLGKVPNNYLITLRKFPTPCGDKIDKRLYMLDNEKETQQHLPDIGHMVTWLGTPGNELNKILHYSYSVQWEDQNAEVNESQQGGGGGFFEGSLNLASEKYRKEVQQGIAGREASTKTILGNMLGTITGGRLNGSHIGDPPYTNDVWKGIYNKHKTYGPIDVIDTTKKRKRGLQFEQKFTLVFEYELRSYYGINGKAALIDLLGNILSTTYTTGGFWGGTTRFTGSASSNLYANLPIFKLAENGELNNPLKVWDAVLESVSEMGKGFVGGIKGDTWQEKAGNLGKDLFGMMFGGLLNTMGRPQKYAVASLISGAPVGQWHLTIGNPMSPIMEIGNLICTGTEIEHYGPMGIDDIPTGIRVTVNLEHGKPRDKVGIEQMYGRGDTRFYAPMATKVKKMYNNSESIGGRGGDNRKYADDIDSMPYLTADVQKQLDDMHQKIIYPLTTAGITENYMNTVSSINNTFARVKNNVVETANGVKKTLSNASSGVKTFAKNRGSGITNMLRHFGMGRDERITICSNEEAFGSIKNS